MTDDDASTMLARCLQPACSEAEAEAEAEAERETERETEAEQRQSRAEAIPALPAAAAAPDFQEPHSSAFAFAEVEGFVRATKPHIRSPGGLARKIWRSGEEDAAIGEWIEARVWPKWVFDPKEPGTVEEKKRFHLQLCEAQRKAEAEALAFNQQQSAEEGAA